MFCFCLNNHNFLASSPKLILFPDSERKESNTSEVPYVYFCGANMSNFEFEFGVKNELPVRNRLIEINFLN